MNNYESHNIGRYEANLLDDKFVFKNVNLQHRKLDYTY